MVIIKTVTKMVIIKTVMKMIIIITVMERRIIISVMKRMIIITVMKRIIIGCHHTKVLRTNPPTITQRPCNSSAFLETHSFHTQSLYPPTLMS